MARIRPDPAEQLFFETIKEHRGSYFTRYEPPVADHGFATLSLIFPDAIEDGEAAGFMNLELERWLARYPVPLMVSAFDASNNLIRVRSGDDGYHLVGWTDPRTGEVITSWKLDDLTAFLSSTPGTRDWRSIYADVPVRTQTEVRAKAHKDAGELAQGLSILRFALVFWFAILPAGIAALGYFGPEWLSLVGVILSWWKAWRTWLELTGRSRPSRSEREKAEKDRKMAHYFHHCECNPEGFARLRAENFEREAHERTRKEAADLAETHQRNACGTIDPGDKRRDDR